LEGALGNAGVEGFKFCDLRHTFASHLVMRGASLKEVQKLLRHRKMTMTLRYAQLGQEEKKRAISLWNGVPSCVHSDMSQNVTFPCSALVDVS
jgi:integrase